MTKRIGSPSHRLSAKHRILLSTAASASMSPPTSSTDSAASPGHISAMSKRISTSIASGARHLVSGVSHIVLGVSTTAPRTDHLALGLA